jgi:hypothetical protein
MKRLRALFGRRKQTEELLRGILRESVKTNALLSAIAAMDALESQLLNVEKNRVAQEVIDFVGSRPFGEVRLKVREKSPVDLDDGHLGVHASDGEELGEVRAEVGAGLGISDLGEQVSPEAFLDLVARAVVSNKKIGHAESVGHSGNKASLMYWAMRAEMDNRNAALSQLLVEDGKHVKRLGKHFRDGHSGSTGDQASRD